MADLTDLSVDELDSLLSDLGGASSSRETSIFSSAPIDFERDTFLEAITKGARDLPETLSNVPSGMWNMLQDASAVYNVGPSAFILDSLRDEQKLPKELYQSLDRTGRAAAIMGGGALGSIGGGAVGSFGGPVGTGAGAVAGGTAGGILGDVLYDILTGGDIPTVDELVNRLGYEGTQDLLTFGGAKTLKGGLKAGLSAAEEAGKFLDLRKPASRTKRAGMVFRDTLDEAGIGANDLEKLDDTGYRSLAEQLDSEQLARTEGALKRGFKESAGAEAEGRAARRAEFNQGQAAAGVDMPGTTAETAGARIFNELEAAKESSFSGVSDLYKKLDKTAEVGGGDLLIRKIETAVDEFVPEQGAKLVGAIDPKVENIMLDIVDRGGNLDVGTMKTYRQVLGDIAYSQSETTVNKGLAKAMIRAMDEAEEASGGQLGAAIASRREAGQRFEQGAPGAVLKRKKYGERNMLNSQIPAKILANADNADAFDKIATFEARQALADYVLSDIDPVIGTKRQGSVAASWRKKDSALRKALTPEQYNAVDSVLSDIESQSRLLELETAASRGSSPTMQFQADERAVRDKFATDIARVAKKHPVAATLGGAVLGGVAGMASGGYMGTLLGSSAGATLIPAIKEAVSGLEGDIARTVYRGLTNKADAIALMNAAEQGSTKAVRALKLLDTITEQTIKKLGISPESLVAPALPNVGNDFAGDSRALNSLSVDELDSLIAALDVKKKELSNEGLPTNNSNLPGDNQDKEMVLPKKVTDELLDALREVESAGGKYLESPVGAKGPYQLMDATGKRIHRILGIKAPYDPYNEDQARAIAKYHLQDGLKRFGTIELALADYNAGHPQIADAVRRAKTKDFESLKDYLPDETAAYVPKVEKALLKFTG